MYPLFRSRMYVAFQNGFSVLEISEITGLSISEVEQALAAAALCFERQVQPATLDTVRIATLKRKPQGSELPHQRARRSAM